MFRVVFCLRLLLPLGRRVKDGLSFLSSLRYTFVVSPSRAVCSIRRQWVRSPRARNLEVLLKELGRGITGLHTVVQDLVTRYSNFSTWKSGIVNLEGRCMLRVTVV